MKKTMLRTIAFVAILTMILSTAVSAQAPAPGRITLPHQRPTLNGDVSLSEVQPLTLKTGPVKVIVELADQPTTGVYDQTIKTVNSAAAETAAVNQLAVIKQAQATMTAALTASKIGAKVLFSAQRVYNGVAVTVDSQRLKDIASLPGVKAIHPLIAKKLDNAYSVPLIGAPQVWKLSSTVGYTGAGIKVGVIDTGIDYLHTNFGGPGTGYNTNDTTKIGDAPNFPGTKVVGGYDFAGDAYDADVADSFPAPDPDPMDCAGHGSHVAGTVAGLGVNADGSTYTGVYDSTTAFTTLRIGPGVAPAAQLYALRVFGCVGTTNLVLPAFDWAVDPNGDGNFADHLDVVNLSLGSSFGSAYDSDAVAADNASLAGVVVVASAGNSGDTYYVNGSPSVATRAIAVAASVDAGSIMDGFQVTAPPSIAKVYGASISANYDWASSTDAGLTGDLVYPATNRTGCAAFAAGTFTGKIALLDWNHLAGGVNGCGSVARTGNAVAAGAVGVILAYDLPVLDISISGSKVVPAVITTQATGDTLKTALASGPVTVRLTKEYNASIKDVDPANIDSLASFTSRGARRLDSFLKPDITAPGMTIFSTSALTGNMGESMNGTSMAAPHVSGVMALLRQEHPDWSVEELKALAMNTATHDLFTGQNRTGSMYGTGRIGAGRVDVQKAAAGGAVLFNQDDPGAVSVSFGEREITEKTTVDKLVTVENKTGTTVSYNVSFANGLAIPGVTFKLLNPNNDTALTFISVRPGGAVPIKVRMEADPALMTHTHDATISELQILDRHWVSEAGGQIQLSQSVADAALDVNNIPTPALRLPVYAVVRPAAAMKADLTKLSLTAKTDQTIALSGTGLTPVAPLPVGITSLVSAYQLLGTSPNEDMKSNDPAFEKALDAADLHYIGAMSDVANPGGGELFFAVNTYGQWTSPNDTEFDIYIDTNRDGTEDYVLFNYNYSKATGGVDPSDSFVSVLVDATTGKILGVEDFLNYWGGKTLDTVLFNNNVMTLGVYLSDLGLDATSGPIDFYVASFSREANGVVDKSNVMTYNPIQPVIDTTGGQPGLPLWDDQAGASISVHVNQAFMRSAPQGVLLFHHNNAANRAEVVPFDSLKYFFPLISK